MSFRLEVKVNGNDLQRGDFFYDKRALYRVEHVSKPRGTNSRFIVRFKLLAKVNLDRQRSECNE